MQFVRMSLLTAIVLSIHLGHVRRQQRQRVDRPVDVSPQILQPIFGETARLSAEHADERAGHARGAVAVVDASGQPLGAVLQTSPQSDHIVGFSGPTNVLIALDAEMRIRALQILSSDDTREHVLQVQRDRRFLRSLDGMTREEVAARRSTIDAVSGATLTSLAIVESVMTRLGAVPRTSLRFPDPVTVDAVRPMFPAAGVVRGDEADASYWHVLGADGRPLGAVLQTSPAADNVVGYQGPTAALLGLDPQGRVIGLTIAGSFDNQPYVDYVREDRHFARVYEGQTLAALAEQSLEASGVEGVSGATMTSQAVAEGVCRAAAERLRREAAEREAQQSRRVILRGRDVGTAAVTVLGVLVGLSPWRGRKWQRIVWQCMLMGYLGLMNGDLVSQALLAGWARNGIPWRTMLGPLVLTAAAFLVPLATGRNVYCSHLCPHGAAQQWLRRRGWRLPLPPAARRMLPAMPAVLLLWVVIVAAGGLPYSLVDIEPFDAWVFRVAGVATLTIAVVGLAVSALEPMAYCRFGCPTGALLNYVRTHRRSGNWTARDAAAAVCLVVSIVLAVIR
jgi:uncharacterized protein with FMN-binding domain